MATEPKKPAAAGKSAGKAAKATPARPGSKAAEPKAAEPKAVDPKAVDSRISVLEAGLAAAESRLAQRTADLETRIGALEGRGTPAQEVKLPDGLPDPIRHGINRAADLVRHNPITALILIVAFLLVAIFS